MKFENGWNSFVVVFFSLYIALKIIITTKRAKEYKELILLCIYTVNKWHLVIQHWWF